MKKILIIATFILLFFNNGMVNAQDNIKSTITKEVIDGDTRLCLTITNNNPKEMVIFAFASWGENDAVGYIKEPVSYIKLTGTGNSLSEKYETGKIVLSRKIDTKTYTNLRPFIILKAGESHKISYTLFGETHRPYKSFTGGQRKLVKRVRAYVKLSFTYPTEKKMFEKEINTNTLSL